MSLAKSYFDVLGMYLCISATDEMRTTEHGEIWYFNDNRFIQLRSIYIKMREKGRELNSGENERERGGGGAGVAANKLMASVCKNRRLQNMCFAERSRMHLGTN